MTASRRWPIWSASAPGPHENWAHLSDTVRNGRPASPIDDDPAAFYVPLVRGTFTTQWRAAMFSAADDRRVSHAGQATDARSRRRWHAVDGVDARGAPPDDRGRQRFRRGPRRRASKDRGARSHRAVRVPPRRLPRPRVRRRSLRPGHTRPRLPDGRRRRCSNTDSPRVRDRFAPVVACCSPTTSPTTPASSIPSGCSWGSR